MTSPYRTGAIVAFLAGLPLGDVAISEEEYADLLELFTDVAGLLPFFPLKIYEPYMIQGELVTIESSGDLIVGWGGKYVTS